MLSDRSQKAISRECRKTRASDTGSDTSHRFVQYLVGLFCRARVSAGIYFREILFKLLGEFFSALLGECRGANSPDANLLVFAYAPAEQALDSRFLVG
jgi:hypothetical protein